MTSFLKNQKNRIRSEPIILLKKPWLVLLIPIILVYMVWGRMKNNETVVYLTETGLDQFPETSGRAVKEIVLYNQVTDSAGFHSLAKRRIEEDPEMNDFFFKTVKRRFEKGDFAVISTDKKGDPLSYVFICTLHAEFTPVGITLPMPENIFGMYDVYTFREARGKGYYSGLFRYIIGLMKKQGYKSMWLWLMKHNTVSISVHYKLGISAVSKILTERMKFGLIHHKVQDVDMPLNELMLHE